VDVTVLTPRSGLSKKTNAYNTFRMMKNPGLISNIRCFRSKYTISIVLLVIFGVPNFKLLSQIFLQELSLNHLTCDTRHFSEHLGEKISW